MNPLELVTLDYEGRPLSMITYEEGRCVVAQEVGLALGYAERGAKFTMMVTQSGGRTI